MFFLLLHVYFRVEVEELKFSLADHLVEKKIKERGPGFHVNRKGSPNQLRALAAGGVARGRARVRPVL